MKRGTLSWLISIFADLIYPPRCVSCRTPLLGFRQNLLCDNCYAGLARIDENSCRFCGSIIGKYAKRRNECDVCRNQKRHYTRVIAAVEYNDIAQHIIHAYKFYNQKNLAPLMAKEILSRLYQEYSKVNFDYIIPVPLHKKKLLKRGYNQSTLLARYISDNLKITFSDDILLRTRNTSPQSLLDSRKRETNIIDAFTATRELAGKKILLIDDVLTTGCTASECAGSLRRAGASRVYVCVFAR